MPLPVIIAGQVILHGIRIVGLRVIPYIIREGTRIAAKQATKQAVKKVGTKKITESGFVIITKDPTKFKLAQKIFGKNKVFRNVPSVCLCHQVKICFGFIIFLFTHSTGVY